MNEIVYITEKVASLLKEKGDFDMAESYLLGAQTKLRVESQMYRALNGTVLATASPSGATRGRVLSSGSSAALDAAVMGAAMAIPSGWGAAAPPRAAAAPPRAAPCVPSRPRDRSLPDREYRYARAAPPPARARAGAPGPMS